MAERLQLTCLFVHCDKCVLLSQQWEGSQAHPYFCLTSCLFWSSVGWESSQRRCTVLNIAASFCRYPLRTPGGVVSLFLPRRLSSFSLSCGHVIFALLPTGQHVLNTRCTTLYRTMSALFLIKVISFWIFWLFKLFSCKPCPVNFCLFWWLLLGNVCWLHLLTLYSVQGSKALFALPLNSRCAYCKYYCRLFIHSMYFLWFTVSDNHGFYRFDLWIVLCASFCLLIFWSFAWAFSFIVKKMLCIKKIINLHYKNWIMYLTFFEWCWKTWQGGDT